MHPPEPVTQLVSLAASGEQAEALQSLGSLRTLTAGMLLVRQFDPPGPMYLILSGEVRVLRMSANGPPGELARLGAGEHVGEIAALFEVPRSASVEAVTDVRALELTPEAVQALARRDPEFARALAESLSARAGRVPAFLGANGWPGNIRS